MTEIIYSILASAIMFFVVGYLLFAIITFIKKTANDNISVIKTRIVFASVLSALFIIKMIMALILGKSIVSELICAILWAIYTAIECNNLKVAKSIINYNSYIMPDFRDINNDKIIDGDFKEITDEDKN